MKLSTLDYLKVVSPHLSPRLVSPHNLQSISKVAGVLPPSSNFGFESRLGDDAPFCDFLVAVIPSDGSRGAWATHSLSPDLGDLPADSPWHRAKHFLADWDADKTLEPVHDAWLEFDIPGPDDPIPEPSFFFGFDDAVAFNYPDQAVEWVGRLEGRPLSDDRERGLRRCFAALPEGGVIFQVGILLARPTDELRLCARRLSPKAILSYLADLDWPGSVDQLARLLDELAPRVDGVNLDLSLGTEVAPSIGLECVVEDGAVGRSRAKAFMDDLIQRGACLAEKRDAIFDWLGYTTEDSVPDGWPEHLSKAARAMGSEIRSTFVRTLNHIKISFRTDEPISAKAYLGVRHFWARDRRTRRA